MKGLDRWLGSWIFRKRTAPPPGVRHVLIAVCDHFEPFHDADKATALARVALWRREHAAICADFRDSDGTPPRHTFFYPVEQWDADVCGRLADLCHSTGGEAEIHLHHDNDTAENLRATLLRGKENLAALGLLSRDGRCALRIHPRELGARPLASRGQRLRSAGRAAHPPSHRLLRRPHAPQRAERLPSPHDQFALLRPRRRPAALARPPARAQRRTTRCSACKARFA